MTLQEHVDFCLVLIKEGYDHLNCGFSVDSEGNDFKPVHYEPQLVLVDDPNSYNFELLKFDEEDSEFEPNFVIIN